MVSQDFFLRATSYTNFSQHQISDFFFFSYIKQQFRRMTKEVALEKKKRKEQKTFFFLFPFTLFLSNFHTSRAERGGGKEKDLGERASRSIVAFLLLLLLLLFFFFFGVVLFCSRCGHSWMLARQVSLTCSCEPPDQYWIRNSASLLEPHQRLHH